jgi:hypothetical protein
MVGPLCMVWPCIWTIDWWLRRDGSGMEVANVGGRFNLAFPQRDHSLHSTAYPAHSYARNF